MDAEIRNYMQILFSSFYFDLRSSRISIEMSARIRVFES